MRDAVAVAASVRLSVNSSLPSWLARQARRSRRGVNAANPGTPPRGLKGFGSGFMPGIVRGMDAAAEAHKDVFMAVPGMNPEPQALRRLVADRQRH